MHSKAVHEHLEREMNSFAICDRHKEAYEGLFSSCDCVVSCPGTFFWAGEHAVLHGGISICQHVPLRVYCGIEPIRYGSGHYGVGLSKRHEDHLVYDPIRDEFREDYFLSNPESSQSRSIVEWLDRISREVGIIPGDSAAVIHTLHELQPARGCNWSGAFATALASALLIFGRQIAPSMIQDWASKPVSALIRNEEFRRLNNIAWRVETAFHKGKASGYGNFTSLVASPYPIFYATVERSDNNPERYPIDIGTNYGLIDQIPYGGFRFSERYQDVADDIRLSQNLNEFAFGLVFSGVKKDTAVSIDITREDVRKRLERAKATLLELEDEGGIVDIWNNNSYFLPLLTDVTTGEELRVSYVQSLCAKGFETMQALLDVLTAGLGVDQRNLRALARCLRDVKGNLDVLGLARYEVDAVLLYLLRACRDMGINEELTGAKPTGGANGGSLLFVLPHGEHRKILGYAIERLWNDVNKEVSLDWLQERDGLEDDGLRVEKLESSIVNRKFRSVPNPNEVVFAQAINTEHGVEIQTRTSYCYPHDLEYLRTQETMFLDESSLTLKVGNGEPTAQRGVPSTRERTLIPVLGLIALALALRGDGSTSYYQVIRRCIKCTDIEPRWRAGRLPRYSHHQFNSKVLAPLNGLLDRKLEIRAFAPTKVELVDRDNDASLFSYDELDRLSCDNYAIRITSAAEPVCIVKYDGRMSVTPEFSG